MKTLLLFTASLLSIGQINSQVLFNKSYQDVSEIPGPFLINIQNNLYFISQNADAGQFGQNRLYKHNPSGTLKYRIPVLINETPNLALKSKDEKLVVLGHNSFCDVVPSVYNFMSKLDTNANAVFTSTYAVSYGDYPKACVQLSDSSYYTFTDSLLIKHSKSGQFISKTNLSLNTISSALLLPNDVILSSAKFGNSMVLTTFSTNLLMGTTVSTPVLFTKLCFYGTQQIMGLGTDGKLYKFSTGLDFIGASSFSGGMVVKDFICNNDSVYSILSSLTNSSNYAVTDTSFNNISQSNTSTHGFNQVAICMNGSEVAILAAGIAGVNVSPILRHHTYSSLSSMSKTSSNNFENDLELTSFIPDSTKVSCYSTNVPGSGEYHCSSYLRPTFTVKNKGTRSVTSFKLNCYDVVSVACGTFYYQESFSGFTLLPGDSITLTATSFARRGGAYDGAAPSFSTSFCFYVSLPNGETDKTLEDNEICGTFNFLTTSIKKYNLENYNLKVFPNPLVNSLKLESDVMIKNIEVTNMIGTTISNQLVNSTKTELTSSEWASGVYFLKIETAQGIAIKKIVKQ